MVTRARWIDRRFNFDFPVGLLPCVIERLRGTAVRLEHLTRSLSPEMLTRRIDDKWSIQEQIGHLTDVEALWEARLSQFMNGVDVLVAADMSNRKTHEAGHNERDFAEVLAEFEQVRESLVRRLEQFDDETAGRSALHPRLNQPMRVVDLAYFAAEHDDQHLASIRELSLVKQP